MNNKGMRKLFLDLSKKEFVYLFSDRFNVVRYLYEKENVAFELIFKSDEDFYLLNEYVAKPRGYFFVRRAIQQILDVKHKWLKLSRMMQKSIEAQLNKEEREAMKLKIQDIIKKEKNIAEGEDNEEIIKKLLNETHKTINKNEI